jgi:hypothetical protein
MRVSAQRKADRNRQVEFRLRHAGGKCRQRLGSLVTAATVLVGLILIMVYGRETRRRDLRELERLKAQPQGSTCYSIDMPAAFSGAAFFSISGPIMLWKYVVERCSSGTI